MLTFFNRRELIVTMDMKRQAQVREILAQNGIDAIVAAGMGMRPMMGFAQAGITVYFENQTPGVGDVAQMAAAGTLPVMGEEHACHH